MAKDKKAKKSADEGYVKYTRESLPRLRQQYQNDVVKKLTDEFGYKNVMVNAGTHEVDILEDDWTAVTRDKQISAHFEHSIAITDDGPWVLSRL